MADRISKVGESGLTLRQREESRDVFLAPKSVSLDLLEDDIQWGLLPIGGIIAIMPGIVGSFIPGGSGQVSNGLIVCDGAAIPQVLLLVITLEHLMYRNYRHMHIHLAMLQPIICRIIILVLQLQLTLHTVIQVRVLVQLIFPIVTLQH
jgi:hypothetical protein